jgi:DNA-directed RNA polymerase subunit M/transcription elongation factor TFIIS
MDIRSQTKPIHLRCPKCGYDFSYNSRHIENEYDKVKTEIRVIIEKITEMNKDNVSKNAPERKRLVKRLNDAQVRLAAIKRTRKSVSESIESDKEKIFRQKIKALIGEEKYVKLRQECEDEMAYNLYDMAIQNHNRFNNL